MKRYVMVVAAMLVAAFVVFGVGSPRSSEPILVEDAGVQPPVERDPVSELLEEAAARRAAGKFREAEILLTRAVPMDGDRADVLAALADLHRTVVLQKLRNNDLHGAAESHELARNALDQLRGAAIRCDVDPATVVAAERGHRAVGDRLRAAIDADSDVRIRRALQCAKNAHRSWARVFTFRSPRNDRDEIVRGLAHLVQPVELGNWSSSATRRAVNTALSRLKAMVASDEFPDLLARAGFEPGGAR